MCAIMYANISFYPPPPKKTIRCRFLISSSLCADSFRRKINNSPPPGFPQTQTQQPQHPNKLIDSFTGTLELLSLAPPPSSSTNEAAAVNIGASSGGGSSGGGGWHTKEVDALCVCFFFILFYFLNISVNRRESIHPSVNQPTHFPLPNPPPHQHYLII